MPFQESTEIQENAEVKDGPVVIETTGEPLLIEVGCADLENSEMACPESGIEEPVIIEIEELEDGYFLGDIVIVED